MTPIGLRRLPLKTVVYLIGVALVLVVAVVTSTGALAQSGPAKVFRGANSATGNAVTLRIYTEAPCTHAGVIAVLTRKGAGPFLEQFKAAVVDWDDGRRYAGCWLRDEDDDVLTIFEDDTNSGYIPFRRFRDEGV